VFGFRFGFGSFLFRGRWLVVVVVLLLLMLQCCSDLLLGLVALLLELLMKFGGLLGNRSGAAFQLREEEQDRVYEG